MKIPYSDLSQDALTGVIEEFITREGTEHGSRDYTLVEKVAQVRKQLEDGEIGVDFDPETGTCNLTREEART
ncbi:MAG: YheU family protein [Pseudohongiellaceae bacterium]